MKEEKSRVNTNDNIKMTTEEAIELIDILKERVSDITLKFPKIGDKIEFEVQAVKDGKKFIVNINRGKIDIKKCTYQGRTYINSIALLRLDVTNSFHINPDGTKIQGPHLHIYSEENEMREAIQFDIKSDDLYDYCLGFFRKFNILEESSGILYQMEMEL